MHRPRRVSLSPVAKTLYLAAAGPGSGKSALALSLFEAMSRRVGRVTAFRPVVRAGSPDPLLTLLSSRYGVDLSQNHGVSYDDVHADPAAAVATVVDRLHDVGRGHDAVLVIGTDYTDAGAATELDINARVALNVGAPVLLVVDGRTGEASDGGNATVAEVATTASVARAALLGAGCQLLGVVANRVPAGQVPAVRAALDEMLADAPEQAVGVVPEHPLLAAPSVAKVFDACDAQLVSGSPQRTTDEALGFVVAAMTLPRVLEYLTPDSLVIVPGDRSDVLVGVLMAHRSRTFPRLSGVLLTGGVPADPIVQRLVAGIGTQLPVGLTRRNTFESAPAAARTAVGLVD